MPAMICAGAYQYVEENHLKPLQSDYTRLATDDYTSVFFSTFPVDNYSEEVFNNYLAAYPIKTSYCISDRMIMDTYFTSVAQNGREISTIYLGVRPDNLSAEELLNIINRWQGIPVEVMIAYPSLEYWQSLDEEEFTATLNAYKDFVNTLMPYYENDPWFRSGNVTLYFFGSSEWVVGNPDNYENNFSVNEGIARLLTLHSFVDRNYRLTMDNYEEELAKFETLVSECRNDSEPTGTQKYPDLSQWDVVFFGDSITAIDETVSYPSTFGSLTKAHVYNCAYGGTSAANTSNTQTALPNVVANFLAKDASVYKSDSLTYKGITDYTANAKPEHQKCFVINFGMNDFFSGHMISSDDPYDITTYAGALRTAIENLQTAYPDATIVLMTPNFTANFDNGETPQSENGGTLLDYIATMESISTEYGLPLYNSYDKLGIDSQNHFDYLQDGCHPNEATRFVMAKDLAKLMQEVITE